jgi:hypothetical protein
MAKKSKKNNSKVKSYNLYRSVLSQQVKKLGILASADCKMEHAMIHSFGVLSLHELTNVALEEKWRDNGNPTIFPESASLLHALCKSKYSAGDDVELELPFDVFSVAIPKGVFLPDTSIEVPSFLVENIPRCEALARDVEFTVGGFEKYCGTLRSTMSCYTDLLDAPKGKGDTEKSLNILFIHPETGEKGRNTLQSSALIVILKSKDFTEFESNLAKLNKASDFDLMTVVHRKALFFIVKTIATLSVYLTATKEANDNKLLKGLPGVNLRELNKKDYIDNNDNNFLVKSTDSIENAGKNQGTGKEVHYRGFHFRNLQHEMFYQGEHESKKRGSRWVWVNDSIIGDKIKASTLIHDELSISLT